MSDSTTRTATPSLQVVKVLAAAVRRAVRLGFPFVGTENLFIALADADGAGRAFKPVSLRAAAAARGTEHWADDDGATGGGTDGGVTALLREANHNAHPGDPLPASGALRECLREATAEAGDGVLTTSHLALALLRAPSGRAAELFTVQRFDVEAAIAAVRAAAEPEDTPALWVLRKAGALEETSRGGWVRLMIRFFVRGGFGGPLLLAVRNEAGRLAVRAGRSEPAALDLVAAVLTLDDQLAGSGQRLRPEHRSAGAAALRAAGVDPAALLRVDLDPSDGEQERALAGARLVAARRGDDVVGPIHLLLAVLDDPTGPLDPALRSLGVDPAGLRASLGR